MEKTKSPWSEIAGKLIWTKTWDALFEQPENAPTKWFPGGEINLCFNCLDRHVEEGNGDRECIVLDSPVTQNRQIFTYNDILEKVSKLASVLSSKEIRKGDRIQIFSPVVVECVVAMLACARIGGISCVTPSDSPIGLIETRINHFKPKAILVVSHHFEGQGFINSKAKIDGIIRNSTYKPLLCFVYQRPGMPKITMNSNDVDWEESFDLTTPVSCTPMESNEPILVVYTSGSSGKPKAIVKAVGGYTVKCFSDWSANFYVNTLVFGAFPIGICAGMDNIVYRPLLNRQTTLLFEGPSLHDMEVNSLYSLLVDNQVTHFMCGSILNRMKAKDPNSEIAAQFDFQNIQGIYVGGGRTSGSVYEWTFRTFDCSVTNFWGQSEIGAIAGAGNSRLGTKIKSIGDLCQPFVGCDVVTMREDNTLAKPYEIGRLLLRLPLPPGAIITLLDNPDLCKDIYFASYPGYFDTKDSGYINEESLVKIEYRSDTLMKQNFNRIWSENLEELVMSHSSVSECCVIGYPDPLKRILPLTLFTMKDVSILDASLVAKEIEQLYLDHFGDTVSFAKVIRVMELPMSRSGKLHRQSLDALVKGFSINVFSDIIVNFHIFGDITDALRQAGY